MKLRLAILGVAIGSLLCLSASFGREPNLTAAMSARSQMRQQIAATPLLERPNRPGHFYGNTVRRAYYRGAAPARPSSLATPPARQ